MSRKNNGKNKGFSEDPAGFAAPKAAGRADTLKIRQIGNSLGVVLPKDVLAKLRVGEGDDLHIVETPDGLELRPYDPALEKQLEAGRSIAKRYRNALRELAK